MPEALHRKRAAIAAASNADSVFEDPVDGLVYTNAELEELVRSFSVPTGTTIQAQPVKRKQQIAALFVEHLGYPRPTRFRGKGRELKPKFRGQLMDVFVQGSTNLQVWNYLPYDELVVADLPSPFDETRFVDCRYVLIPVVNGQIGICRILSGADLDRLDRTKTRTIKYQATLPPSLREKQGIRPLGFANNHEPVCLNTLQIDGLVGRLGPLMAAKLIGGTDRQVGQDFHRRVAACLGLPDQNIDDGQFPDMPGLAVEVKFQTSPTIDLGKHLPTSEHDVRPGLSARDVTYIIGYGTMVDGSATVNGILICMGRNFDDHFPIWNAGEVYNSKIQIPIPASWVS